MPTLIDPKVANNKWRSHETYLVRGSHAAGSRSAAGCSGKLAAFCGASAAALSQQPLPLTWDAKKNVLWQADVPGRGWSSPVVWGDRVFVTAVVNDKTPPPRPGLYIQDLHRQDSAGRACLEGRIASTSRRARSSGRRRSTRARPAGPIHLKNTYASETPVTDGEHVYAYFGNLGLFCFDMDGNAGLVASTARRTRRAWAGAPAASPVLHKDRLYLVNDNEEKSFLLRSGQEDRQGTVEGRARREEQLGHAVRLGERAAHRDRHVRHQAGPLLRPGRQAALGAGRHVVDRHPDAVGQRRPAVHQRRLHPRSARPRVRHPARAHGRHFARRARRRATSTSPGARSRPGRYHPSPLVYGG